jgi:hypothetical protein
LAFSVKYLFVYSVSISSIASEKKFKTHLSGIPSMGLIIFDGLIKAFLLLYYYTSILKDSKGPDHMIIWSEDPFKAIP